MAMPKFNKGQHILVDFEGMGRIIPATFIKVRGIKFSNKTILATVPNKEDRDFLVAEGCGILDDNDTTFIFLLRDDKITAAEININEQYANSF